MKVCIVVEGCYPYVVGGVSGWVHSLIQSFPNLEFIVLAIVANRDTRGKFAYELPSNLTQVYELYLEDVDWSKDRKKRKMAERDDRVDYDALESLLLNHKVKWEDLFKMFRRKDLSIDRLLMGEEFLRATRVYYKQGHSDTAFSDFLWNMRSIYLPLFFTMTMNLPRADIYHCLSTGYAGILGSMAKTRYDCKLMISEHGIYTREREEELIKADWISGVYKNVWIEQFRKMSLLAYEKADLVTSLYRHAKSLQIELGCPADKTLVTPNGIDTARLENLDIKDADDENINIGAVLRVTPIKDVKTMINAFGYAKERYSRLKLWIMGPCDEDEVYAEECFELVETLGLSDVVFTGRVDIKEYLGKMDMTILTSISEGQPLTILESFAAKKPVIATDVGNCRGLIYGEEDEFGEAGILTHIMNVEEISRAMTELAQNPKSRERMGENGYNRLMAKYKIEYMKDTYQRIYRDFADDLWTTIWPEEDFVQGKRGEDDWLESE